MSPSSQKAKAAGNSKLHIAYPMVFVSDVTKALAFYKNKLGFKVDYLYGEPPFYGMISRDGASLHLRHVDKHPFHHAEEDLLTASIPVDEVQSLFLEFKAKRVAFHQTLKRQPWGATDFIVKDPDGNLLQFASSLK